LFEFSGKWRYFRVQGPTTFFPSLTLPVANASGLFVGLQHRIWYTASASVFTGAIKQSDPPSGYDPLGQFL
ncbi:kanamycin nucleotidyltransferase C-terminal domain-containing protein, partial [Staphylococcus aureus]